MSLFSQARGGEDLSGSDPAKVREGGELEAFSGRGPQSQSREERRLFGADGSLSAGREDSDRVGSEVSLVNVCGSPWRCSGGRKVGSDALSVPSGVGGAGE